MALKLAKAFADSEILFADYGDVPQLATSSYQFKSLGFRNDEVVAHQLLSFCLDNQVDVLLPLSLFEVAPLAKSSLLFEEFGIQLMVPGANELANFLGNDKSAEIAVFLNGKSVFSTNKNTIEGPNGAFYILNGNKALQLITL